MVFQLLAPAVDWLDYLSSSLSPLDLNDTEPVVLYAREYLQQVSDLINKTDRRSETPTSPNPWSNCLTTELPPPPPAAPTHGPPVSSPVYLSSLVNNYMIWTLVQKTVASLDQRFENAQDKLLESLIGTKKVRFPGFPWIWCELKSVVLQCCVCKGQVIHRCPCFGFVAVLHATLADVY